MAVVVFLVIVGIFAYLVYTGFRKAVARAEAQIAAAAAELGPVFGGVACDVKFMLQVQKGLRGTYAGMPVTAWFASQSSGQHDPPKFTFVLWADGQDGAAMWTAMWRDGNPGEFKLGNADPPTQVMLEAAGLREALAPTAGRGADTMYIPGFHRVSVGWPATGSVVWPDAAEFKRRLDVLAAVAAINRKANPATPHVS